MKTAKETKVLAFYLSCLQWKIGANDHELLCRTGFFEVLAQGNQKDKQHNPIIYGWDSIQFGYTQNESPKFSDFLYQALKYFVVSSFGRLVSDNKEQISLSGSQSKEVGQNTLTKAFSTINSQVVEVLLHDLIKIIFNKVDVFVQEYESFKPGEYMIYSNFRENPEYSNHLNAKQGFFHVKENSEEQIHENDEKFYQKLMEEQIRKELVKDASVSKYFESTVMMLRLFEYILSVSMKMKEVQEFVLKTINPDFILNLVKIILMGHIRYSFVGVKIIEKMVDIGMKDSTLSSALEKIASSDYMKSFLTSYPKIHSEKSPFLTLILQKIAEIHRYKWVLSDHCHSQEFSLAKQMVFLAQKMIVSEHEPLWREEYESMIKDLTTNEDDYRIQEFETMLALIGGQTVSCDFGSTGTLSDNDITVLGYSKDYSNNQNSPAKWNLEYSWNEKNQVPICKINNPDATKKYKIQSCKIQDLDFSHKYDKTNCPVLSKERITYLLFDDPLKESSDLGGLYKRFLKLNALSTQLSFNSIKDIGLSMEQTLELLQNCFIKFLESKAEWNKLFDHTSYGIQLNELLKYSCESKIALKFMKKITCSFENKIIILTHAVANLEEEVELIKIKKVFNYPTINGLKDFDIVREKDLQYNRKGALLIDSFKLSDEHEIIKMFSKSNVIITTPCDIYSLYHTLKQYNKSWILTKSLVVISEDDFKLIQSKISSVSDAKPTDSSYVDLTDTFVKEVSNSTGISSKFIRNSIKKGHERHFTRMSNDFIEACEKGEVPMATEEELKENHKEDEKEKKQVEAQYEVGFNTQEIRDSLKSKLSLECFKNNLNNFCEYNSQGKAGSVKTINDYAIFEFIKDYNSKTFLQKINNCLQINCRLICQKIIQDITEESIEDILEIIYKDAKVRNMFLLYLSKSVEKSYQDQYLKLVKRIITFTRNNSLGEFEDLLYKELIIKPFEKIFSIIFNRDSYNIEWAKENIDCVDIQTILGILEIFTDKKNIDIIYRNSSIFDLLLSNLLFTLLQFPQDGDHKTESIRLIYKLCLPVMFNPENYDRDVKFALLNSPTIAKLLEKFDFSITLNSNKNIPPMNKMVIQMFIFLKQLSYTEQDLPCAYKWTKSFSEILKANSILSGDIKFELVAYMMYLQDFVKQEDLDKLSLTVSMMKNSPECNYVAKIDMAEFDEYKAVLKGFDKLRPHDSVAITTDFEGENAVAIIDRDNYGIMTDLHLDKKYFYIHFPYRKSSIIAGGINSDYRIGKATVNRQITASPLNLRDGDFIQISSENERSFGLTKEGKLYLAGKKFTGDASNETFLEYPITNIASKIVRIETSKNNIIALTEDGKLYYQGLNEHHHLDPTQIYTEFVYLPRPNEDTEKIIDLSIDNSHHFYITDNHKLYGLGSEIMEKFGTQGDLKTYQEVPLEPGMLPLKIRCCKSGTDYPPVFLLAENNGHNEILVAGQGGGYLLGLGPDVSVPQGSTFNKILYNEDLLDFIDIDVKGKTIYALTSRGKIYGWGDSDSYKLGAGNYGQVSTMIQISQLSDYYVHEIKASPMGLFCVASPTRARNYKQLLFLGSNLSFLESTRIKDCLHSIDWIMPENVCFIEASDQVFFLKSKDETQYTSETVHKGYQCSVTGEEPIVGTMHFFKDKNGEFKYLSQEGFNREKENLPNICYATKYYIKDIENKNWRSIDLPDLEFEESKDYEPEYICKMGFGNETREISTTTEEKIFTRNEADIDPIIYYRVAKPLKKLEKLRYIQGYNYFDEVIREGFSFKFCGEFNSCRISERITKINEKEFNRIKNNLSKFEPKFDEKLLEAINKLLTNDNIDLINDPDYQIDYDRLELPKKDKIKEAQKKIIQTRIRSISFINKHMAKVLPFVDLNLGCYDGILEKGQESQFISANFNKFIKYLYTVTKDKIIQNVCNNLPTQKSEPGVSLSRHLVQHHRDKGRVDHDHKWSTFGVVMNTVQKDNYQALRIKNSNSKAWNIKMLGEGSADAGGPFRDSISNLTEELYSKCLPLLIPTQNNKNSHGWHRDCYTIDPSSTRESHFEMYKFLGALMGMAFRSGTVIDLKFPPIIWKQLSGDTLTMDDLKGTDIYAVQAIQSLKENKSKFPKEEFEMGIDLTFTTQLSNGDTVPICEGGEDRPVCYEDVEEYCDLVLQTRFGECRKQINKIKEGFEAIFPVGLLGLLSWKEIETRVRGPDEIRTEDLISIVSQSSGSNYDEFNDRFWRVFEGFNQEERSLFLKFVWGRSRLPPKNRLRDRNFQITLIGSKGSCDGMLPQSHTCFFTIDLPRYSNDEVCRDKILYASFACGEIDTDNSASSISAADGDYD